MAREADDSRPLISRASGDILITDETAPTTTFTVALTASPFMAGLGNARDITSSLLLSSSSTLTLTVVSVLLPVSDLLLRNAIFPILRLKLLDHDDQDDHFFLISS